MELRIKLFLMSLVLTIMTGCSYNDIQISSNGLSYYMRSDLCAYWVHLGKYAVCYDSNENYTTTVAPLSQQQAKNIMKQQAADDAVINNSIQQMNQSNLNMQMQMLNNNMMLLNNKMLLDY